MQKSIPASLAALTSETAQLITACALPRPAQLGRTAIEALRRVRRNGAVLLLLREVTRATKKTGCCAGYDHSTAQWREIVVDAKTPLDAFLDPAAQRTQPRKRSASRSCGAREGASERLSKQAYWKQFEKAPDFVVCFLPSEALFSAALEADPSLIEFSAQTMWSWPRRRR